MKRKPDDSIDNDSVGPPAKKSSMTLDAGSLTSAQKSAVNEFAQVTRADKSAAAKLLKQHNWNVSSAVNAYFQSGAQTVTNPARAPLAKLFDKYRDDPQNEPDEINAQGTSTLLGDMDIQLDDIGALIFSELVSSPSLGKVTREGFVDGCAGVGADTLPKIRSTVMNRRAQLPKDPAAFKAVYNHTFPLALQPGQKSLSLDVAIEFWRMLFGASAFEWRSANAAWLDWWLQFCEEKWRRAVNKDLWRQTLTFAEASLKDEALGFWSEDGSWPSVIDDFVEWVRKEKKAGGGGEAMDVE